MNDLIDILRDWIGSTVPHTEEDGGDNERSLHLATAALLFEVAMADQVIHASERDQIADTLTTAFGLTAQETESLVGQGRAAAEESVGLQGFTSLVNQNWSMHERGDLIDHMWAVVWADGRLDAHEQHLMRKLASLLYIPHKRYITAKMKALEAARAARDSQATP